MTDAQGHEKPITLVEVAQRLGVSKSTVSAAFTGRGTITAARREAVKRAATELGYEPNPHAQQLAQGTRGNMVCLCAHSLGVGPITRVIQLLQYAVVMRGIAAPIHVTGLNRSEADYQVAVFRSLRMQRPRAIVCCLDRLLPGLRDELKRYMASGGHVIGLDGGDSDDIGSDWVRHDGEYNAYTAAKHLLDNGHRKIGLYLPNPSPHTMPRERDPIFEGYLRAMKEFGVTPHPEWKVQESYYEDGGMRLAKRFFQMEDRPTAMFVVNDNAASAFVQQLLRAGLRVPEDISVVGHDDDPSASACVTPLTTVSWPIQEMVSHTETLLFDRPPRTTTPATRQHVLLRGELRIRSSVAPYRG
jgi:DNA-binding LacI/PurR family transcriptional regulator